MREMSRESAELLRHGIIARACMDYDTAIRYLARPPEKQTEAGIIRHEHIKADCERFFLGNWFRCLCNLDGGYVMRIVAENGYYCNNFVTTGTARKKYDGYERRWREQGEKRREQRRKEMEEYEKRRKKQGNEKSVAP